MLVVDTNVVAYAVIEGEKTHLARELWAVDCDWVAPRLLSYELANVFAVLVRRGAVASESARAGLADGLGLVHLMEQEPDPGRILEISTALKLSAYDASFLAVAEMLQMPLGTEDAGLQRSAPQLARSLESLLGT